MSLSTCSCGSTIPELGADDEVEAKVMGSSNPYGGCKNEALSTSRGSPVRLFGGSTAIVRAVACSGGALGGRAQLSVSTGSNSNRQHRAIIAVPPGKP